MTLNELLVYENITIQCHDFPDADALASGFALYKFFEANNKNVRFIYSGSRQISKANLVLMVNKLSIPVEYVAPGSVEKFDGLLITTDCQYGSGNVTKFLADEYAIIDHHQVENEVEKFNHIKTNYNSCSTVVWEMIKKEGATVEPDVATALYYGLYTDTNMLAELSNPKDRDMADGLNYNKMEVISFRNCNISIQELDIAGMAILRYSLNNDYHFAVIKSNPCDPNVLGLIADFMLQVDTVESCVVFAENEGGIKISVRSCVREINASELAAFLTEGVGSGGGHFEKAGGWISQTLFNEKYPAMHAEGYFNNRMMEYYRSFEVVEAGKTQIDTSDMEKYVKVPVKLGYIKTTEAFKEGTPLTIRTIEGDIDVVADENIYVVIGIKGEVYPNKKEKFERMNKVLEDPYIFEKYVLENEYVPTAKNRITGETVDITKYARLCETTGTSTIYARQIDRTHKVFTLWSQESYMLGKPGDYLAVREDDPNDIYIIENKIFQKTYKKV